MTDHDTTRTLGVLLLASLAAWICALWWGGVLGGWQ